LIFQSLWEMSLEFLWGLHWTYTVLGTIIIFTILILQSNVSNFWSRDS
jgi:hypothetical protein